MYRPVTPFVLGPLGQTPTIDISGVLAYFPAPCNDPAQVLAMLQKAVPNVPKTGNPAADLMAQLTAFAAQINMPPEKILTPEGGAQICAALQQATGGGGGGVVPPTPPGTPAPTDEGWWAGLSKNEKIAVGVGGAVVAGGLVYMIAKK